LIIDTLEIVSNINKTVFAVKTVGAIVMFKNSSKCGGYSLYNKSIFLFDNEYSYFELPLLPL
jgi:hypothetical protein